MGDQRSIRLDALLLADTASSRMSGWPHCHGMCTEVCSVLRECHQGAHFCAGMSGAADVGRALRQGYKVGYGDVGIDESKELALTLTSRSGLWASPKVDQLCQASRITSATVLDLHSVRDPSQQCRQYGNAALSVFACPQCGCKMVLALGMAPYFSSS